MTLYEYVGPLELQSHAHQTARFLVETPHEAWEWAHLQAADELVATFVVDEQNRLWIADRRTEHIACARSGKVQSAGELEFQLVNHEIEVVGATNQSTGFCPRVESWAALQTALLAIRLPHPKFWTRAFEFRRCNRCGELNLVKDAWFVCTHCEADLPSAWNIGNEILV